MIRRNFRSLGASLLVTLLAGCGGLRVEHVDTTQRRPNNVWVFFTVQQEGKPVAGLTADDFDIYEDGKLVSPADSKQVAQNPDRASVSATLLLVDLSGAADPALIEASRTLVDRVGKTHKVGVYAFDGSERLYPLVPFVHADGATEPGLDGLRDLKPKDPSTNLYGAVVQGVRELEHALDRDGKPVKLGTLVVLASGGDRAARVSRDQMLEVLGADEHRRYQLYAIGLGAAAKEAHLQDVGRSGTELVADVSGVSAAFDRVAERIDDRKNQLYLLSYCTPARRGEHELRIEARTQGDKPSVGSLRTRFVAEGFGPPPECDPNLPPTFEAPSAAPADGAKNADEKKPSQNPSKAVGGKAPTVIDWKPSKDGSSP